MIGFGFLFPIFFIVSGMEFDLLVLLHRPTAPPSRCLFLLLFLVVRGPLCRSTCVTSPGTSWCRWLSTRLRDCRCIVVITTIGVSEGRMLAINASALVAVAFRQCCSI